MDHDIEEKAPQEERIHPIGRSLLWIENSDNIGRMIGFLAVMCFFLLVGDFVFNRYGYFDFEETYGFYAVFGVVALLFITLATRVLRFLVERSEDYYGNASVDGEKYPEKGLDVKEFGRD
ncbi:MAG: hypothetical protein AAGK33_06435 [Pseudomonadota bacterium]